MGSLWARHHCWLNKNNQTPPCHASASLSYPRAELQRPPGNPPAGTLGLRWREWPLEAAASAPSLDLLPLDLAGSSVLEQESTSSVGSGRKQGSLVSLVFLKLLLSHLSEAGSSHKRASRQRIAPGATSRWWDRATETWGMAWSPVMPPMGVVGQDLVTRLHNLPAAAPSPIFLAMDKYKWSLFSSV